MLSKHFYLQIILRVVLISTTALGISLFVYFELIYVALGMGLLLMHQSRLLIRYINRMNQKLAFFFESVKNEDFSLKFPEDNPDITFRELNKRVNRVNEQIQEIFLENRAQETYFKEVLKRIDIGILSYDMKGHVLFANPSVKKLLNCEPLSHIRQLEPLNPELFELLESSSLFDSKLVESSNERESFQLTLKLSDFKSPKGRVRLLTVQDIRQELDEKETDSWIKLIRVLTHEIMNTVTPITSISSSILSFFKNGGESISVKELEENRIESTVKGLEVIKDQGNDLMDFVQSYRSMLTISTPDKEIVQVGELLERVRVLFAQSFLLDNVELHMHVEPIDLELFIDQKQIMQVLINLCKNAFQSLLIGKTENREVNIIAGIHASGEKFIEVIDNGVGIPKEVLDQVFIPFFTTKETGSGIGLSLSKQILRLHGGSLLVYSIPNKTTCFSLNFR